MTSTLTAKDKTALAKLGRDISIGLSCNLNGSGIPCRTDRLEAVKDMKKYLEIHDYTVTPKNLP